jgi:hypothetical protein
MAPGLSGYYAAAREWIDGLRANPPPEGWAGVYEAKEK